MVNDSKSRNSFRVFSLLVAQMQVNLHGNNLNNINKRTDQFAHPCHQQTNIRAITSNYNLNKIALIRNSRDTVIPSVTEHAQMCIDAGANGITVHPRPDQRHIRADDCRDLAPMLDVEFNMDMAVM